MSREKDGGGASSASLPTALSSPTAIEPASQSRPSGLQSAGAELLDLAERCEKAAGPDRELDFAILCHVDPRALRTGPLHGDPKYTASIDDAMTLVPEGWFGMNVDICRERASVRIGFGGAPESIEAAAATTALALCAACLRARAASVDTHPKGGDAVAAPFMSGAVPAEERADAQPETPKGQYS